MGQKKSKIMLTYYMDGSLPNGLFFTIAEKIREMRAVNTQYSIVGNLKINKSMFFFRFLFQNVRTLSQSNKFSL